MKEVVDIKVIYLTELEMDSASYFMRMEVHTKVNGKMEPFMDMGNCFINLTS